MRRAAVFAHYSNTNEIEDYVVYYLKNLKSFVETLVFVSDSSIKEEELSKINPYVNHIIAEPHGEYDFGSYKKGYFYLKENGILNSTDELIFANDSCYAPLFPLGEMFDAMEKNGADFWGNTQNYTEEITHKNLEHLQSYFLAFKKNVFSSNVFDDFITNISKEEKKGIIIEKYEIGLTLALQKAGYKYDSYCNTSKIRNNTHSHSYSSLVLNDRSPFLKRGLLLLKPKDFPYPLFIKNLIKKTEYDFELIEKDIRKNRTKLPIMQKSCFFLTSLIRTIKWRVKKLFE